MIQATSCQPQCCATGEVLQDGTTQGRLAVNAAQNILAQYEASPPPRLRHQNLGWAYGCNMVSRARAIGHNRFDENLPLSGWQEDIDFTDLLMSRHFIANHIKSLNPES